MRSPFSEDMAAAGTEKAALDIDEKRLLLFSPQEKQFPCGYVTGNEQE